MAARRNRRRQGAVLADRRRGRRDRREREGGGEGPARAIQSTTPRIPDGVEYPRQSAHSVRPGRDRPDRQGQGRPRPTRMIRLRPVTKRAGCGDAPRPPCGRCRDLRARRERYGDCSRPPAARATACNPPTRAERGKIHGHEEGCPRAYDHRRWHPGVQRRVLADGRARRAHPAAGPLPHRADGQLQPRADPRAAAAREGGRRLRPLRGDRGRQRVHEGFAASARRQDRHAHPLLHRRRRARQPRHLARPARLRAEVLHPRGQLRHGRQQHAGLLRAGPDEVPALHPLAEAPGGHRPARPRHAVGLLDALARVGPSGGLADGRPRHPEVLAPHERLLEPHVHVGQCEGRALLGQVPLQDRPGHRVPHAGRTPTGSPASTPTTTGATCSTRSSGATTRAGR